MRCIQDEIRANLPPIIDLDRIRPTFVFLLREGSARSCGWRFCMTPAWNSLIAIFTQQWSTFSAVAFTLCDIELYFEDKTADKTWQSTSPLKASHSQASGSFLPIGTPSHSCCSMPSASFTSSLRPEYQKKPHTLRTSAFKRFRCTCHEDVGGKFCSIALV